MEKPQPQLDKNIPKIEPSKKPTLLIAAAGACCGAPLLVAGVVGVSTLGIFAGFVAIVAGIYKLFKHKIGMS